MAVHPPADMILEQVSSTYELNWNDHSKLKLACAFIDDQRATQAFEKFCNQQALAETEIPDPEELGTLEGGDGDVVGNFTSSDELEEED